MHVVCDTKPGKRFDRFGSTAHPIGTLPLAGSCQRSYNCEYTHAALSWMNWKLILLHTCHNLRHRKSEMTSARQFRQNSNIPWLWVILVLVPDSEHIYTACLLKFASVHTVEQEDIGNRMQHSPYHPHSTHQHQYRHYRWKESLPSPIQFPRLNNFSKLWRKCAYLRVCYSVWHICISWIV